MYFVNVFKRLCPPAYLYLVISLITITLMIMQNAGNKGRYCLGHFACNVPNTTMVFVAQFLYVAFWTFVLNCICKAGYSSISWLIVLMPIILFFVLLGAMILHQGVILI